MNFDDVGRLCNKVKYWLKYVDNPARLVYFI